MLFPLCLLGLPVTVCSASCVLRPATHKGPPPLIGQSTRSLSEGEERKSNYAAMGNTRPLVVGPASGPESPFPLQMEGKVIKGFGRGSKEVSSYSL